MNKKIKILGLIILPIILLAATAYVATMSRQNRFIIINKTEKVISSFQLDIALGNHTATNIPSGSEAWIVYEVPQGDDYIKYSFDGRTSNGGEIKGGGMFPADKHFGRRDKIVLSPQDIWRTK